MECGIQTTADWRMWMFENMRIGKGIKNADILRIISWSLYILMLLLQVRLLVCFHGDQFSDFAGYVHKAEEIREAHAFYPRTEDLYNVYYLHAPGYVNFLALVLRLIDDLHIIFILNILFLQILLFSSKYMVFQLTDSRICTEIYQLLYCVYFSLGVGGGIVLANTEMPFCTLVFLSMAMMFTKKRCLITAIIAGVLMGIANWIRPVMILFLPAVLWGGGRNISKKLRDVICYCAAMLVSILCIGGASFINCGKFVYQSTTMGINLFVGNNPIADGNNHWDAVLSEDLGEEAADWTYEEWENHFLHKALDWMKQNPSQVIALVPYRMFYLWANDVYFATAYTDNEIDVEKTEYIVNVADRVLHLRLNELEGIDWIVIVSEGYFFLLLLLAVIGVVRQIQNKTWIRWLGIYSIPVLGSGMIMLMFGHGRFHFPYMIAVLMIAQGAFGQPGLRMEQR